MKSAAVRKAAHDTSGSSTSPISPVSLQRQKEDLSEQRSEVEEQQHEARFTPCYQDHCEPLGVPVMKSGCLQGCIAQMQVRGGHATRYTLHAICYTLYAIRYIITFSVMNEWRE